MPKFHVSGRLFFNVRLPSSADASSIDLAHVPIGSIVMLLLQQWQVMIPIHEHDSYSQFLYSDS